MKKIIVIVCALIGMSQLSAMKFQDESYDEGIWNDLSTGQVSKKNIFNTMTAKEYLKDVENVNFVKYYDSLLYLAVKQNNDFIACELIDRGACITRFNAKLIFSKSELFETTLKKHTVKIFIAAYQPVRRLTATFLMGLLTPDSAYKWVNWLWNGVWGLHVFVSGEERARQMFLKSPKKWSIVLLESGTFIAGILARYYLAEKMLNKAVTYAPRALKLENLLLLTEKYQNSHPKTFGTVKYGMLLLATSRLKELKNKS